MRYGLKYMLIAWAALAFITPMAFAGQPSSLDWRSDNFMFAKNCVMETTPDHECVCDKSIDGGHSGDCRMKGGCRYAKADTTAAAVVTPRRTSFDLGDVHKYLGYSTVLLVGLAAATSGDNGAHYGTAYGAAALGAATVATGFVEYGDRFDLSYGLLWQDNAHIILGTVGAIACIAAVAAADSDGGGGHAGAGVGGGAAMALSIITIRW